MHSAIFKLLAVASVGLTLTQALQAQDATKPADAPATTEPATPPATESTSGEPPRSLGEAVADPNALGSIYVKETSGDWSIRCIRTDLGADPCQLYQALLDAQGTNVAEITMVGLPEGQEAAAGATVTTPLGTLLTEQVLMQVDSGEAKRYPFTWCDKAGCYARIGFTSDGLAALKRGNAAKVTVVPLTAPDQQVVLTMSLKGFTAGFDKMDELNKLSVEAQAKAAAAVPAADAPAAPATPASAPANP